jgi:hypothetical protein
MSIDTDDIVDNAVTNAKLSLDSVYTAWLTSGGMSDIVFKRHIMAFDPSINLSTGSSSPPKLAATGYNVYCVWAENAPRNYQIMYRRSTDGGASFGSTVNLSNSAVTSYGSAVSASEYNVYVVWHDNSSGEYDIMYRRSTDGGASFGSSMNLSNSAEFSGEADVATSGNNVYVVWRDFITGSGDIYYCISTDRGASFGGAMNLSNTTLSSTAPALAALGNNVYVVWVDAVTGNTEIFYARSTDSGASFSAPVNLSNSPAFSPDRPAISASGNNVYVVWKQAGLANHDILYARSTDGGASFSAPVNISAGAFSQVPAITASGNNVYVVWVDNISGNWDVLYRRSTDGGASFGAPVDISYPIGNVYSADIVATNNLT